MSEISKAAQDIDVRRLLAAFDAPIDNAKNHKDRDKVHTHLKYLCPDPAIPLQDANAQERFTKNKILANWKKQGAWFDNAVTALIQKYPFQKDDDDLGALAQQLQSFQEDVVPLDCSAEISQAIEDVAAAHPDALEYPETWKDDDSAGAKAALEKFITQYNARPPPPPTGGGRRGRGGGPPPGDPDDAPEKLWPKFTALVKDGTIKKGTPHWNMIRSSCPIVGCDWADVKFMVEFGFQNTSVLTGELANSLAQDFIRTCPEILPAMDKDFFGDKDMHARQNAYRIRHPRTAKSTDSRGVGGRLSKTPAQDRVTVPSRPKKAKVVEDFDVIWVHDHDQGDKRVKGKIEYAFGGFLDVLMPKIVDPESDAVFSNERYNLFKQTKHPEETRNFKAGAPDRFLEVSKPASLEDCRWKDFKLNHFTYARPPRQDQRSKKIKWPRYYAVGYIKTKDKDERWMTAWVRTTVKAGFPSENIDQLVVDQRAEDGLPHPGVAREAIDESSAGSDSDAGSEAF